MHSIPGSPRSPPRYGKTVVYLQHGLLDSSASWVSMGPRNGFAYLLADLGYDVWLGNARGNTYSRNHVKNDPDGRRGNRRQFWSFTWHEIGTIDLPAMIEFISSKTGQRKMHYAGHSQGTTSFLVLASERPEYNDRFISVHLLAPIAYMSNLKSPGVQAAAFAKGTIEVKFHDSLLFFFT